MGLIINQGVQDTSKDLDYGVIVENNVLVKLTSISLHEKFENTLEFEFTIMRGPYAQRKVWDNVSFDPKSEFSWKYRGYRKAAGCEYTPGEPATIDIEALMLNKPFVLDLAIRKGKDGNDYQGVRLSKTTVASLTGGTKAPAGFGAPRQGFGGAVPTQPAQNPFAQPQNAGWGAPAPAPQAQQQAWGTPAPQAQPQEQWGGEEETLDLASDDLPF